VNLLDQGTMERTPPVKVGSGVPSVMFTDSFRECATGMGELSRR
jgi:hypothetical protein